MRSTWLRSKGAWHSSAWTRAIREWGDARSRLAVESNPWGHIPQEILLDMVHEIKDVRTLVAASLTCRAWYKICAPMLYRNVQVESSGVSEFVSHLSHPASYIVPYLESLSICGGAPWPTLPTLLKLLPRISALSISGNSALPCSAYNPALLRLSFIQIAHITSSTAHAVTWLCVDNQWFASTGDVLRLLASFPHLLHTHLSSCIIQTTSTITPSVSSTTLNKMLLSQIDGRSQYKANISSLGQWWKWPHRTSDPRLRPFPGLRGAAARSIMEIVHATVVHLQEWMDISLATKKGENDHSWSLEAQILCASKELIRLTFQVEHEFEASGAVSGISHDHDIAVKHIVIHLDCLKRKEGDSVHRHMLSSIDGLMAKLRALRTVIMEVPDEEYYARLVDSLVLLHASNKVRVRTREGAKQSRLALNVRLKAIRLSNVYKETQGRSAEFFVSVSVDGDTQYTSNVIMNESYLTWRFDEPKILSVTLSSSLSFAVYSVRRGPLRHGNKFHGQFSAPLTTFLNDGTYSHHLTRPKAHSWGRIRVDVVIDDSGWPTWRNSIIVETSAKVARIDEDHRGSAAAPAAESGGSTILGQAVDNLGRVVTFVDNFLEVHLYCKTAWIILSAVYKAVKDQCEMDDAMRFLIIELKDAIAIVRECRDLRVLQGATDVVKELAKWVIVGASLIDEYMKHHTLGRTYIAASTSLDGRIKVYKDELHRLHQMLVLHLLIDVRLTVRADKSQEQATAVTPQIPAEIENTSDGTSSQTVVASTCSSGSTTPSGSSADASPSIPTPKLCSDILPLEELQSLVSLSDSPVYENRSPDSEFLPWLSPVHQEE